MCGTGFGLGALRVIGYRAKGIGVWVKGSACRGEGLVCVQGGRCLRDRHWGMNDLVANSQSTAVRCCLDFLNSRRILVLEVSSSGTFSLHYELRFISMCGGGVYIEKGNSSDC